MLLVVAVCVKVFPVGPTRLMIWFDFTYNTGLILTVLLLGIRGCLEVVGTSLSVRGNLVISGLAGVGHILLGGGIVLFFLCLKQSKQVD